MFEGIVEFVAVAETSGFSSAAKKLGVSTSHVSRQVLALEERLNVKLVARTTRKVSLTDAGHEYFMRCREIMNSLEESQQQLLGVNTQLEGRIRVSLAGDFSERIVAPLIAAFSQTYRNIVVELDFNSHNINLIDEGFDFAIRYGELEDANIIARKLTERRLVAAASPSYLQQYGTPQTLDDLKSHRSIIANKDSWTFHYNGQDQVVKVKNCWRSNNITAILTACQHGLGITYLPDTSYRHLMATGALTPILQDYCNKMVPTWIVYPNRRFLSGRARLLIDFLLAQIGKGV